MSQCYLQLTLPDRRRVHQLLERKVPIAEIARQLGRHRSTIYRELKRNTFHDAEFPEYSGYYSGIANDISKEPRRRLRKLSRHPELRELVIEQLKALWSPEQIAGRLLADGVSAVRVCTGNDLPLHLWQGRLSAAALSASAGRPPQAPPALPQAP